MIIGIDASRAVKKQRTGTENYSRNLIFELAKIDSRNQYILYVGSDYDGSFDNFPKNFLVKIIPNKKYWTQVGLSLEMIKNKPDVLFVPSHILPTISGKRSVVTIHDLAWKYFPEVYSNKEIRLQDLSIRRALKKHADIIVYSKSTASDLKKFYPKSAGLINFVPMGFDSSGHCNLPIGDPVGEERHGLPQGDPVGNLPKEIASPPAGWIAMTNQPYILYVGRLESKKNLVNLIQAYDMLRSERDIKEKLVLVGKPGFGHDQISVEISKSKFKADIIETGFVSDDERSSLYQNASLFVFPSLFEGFGFPILEAFAAGIPVVTSNVSSMPEVAGNGAILINPKKPFEIAAAMSQIMNKPELARKLVRAGQKELEKYSWEICAQQTLKVLTGMDNE
ncbi:MAG: glycosyltransferase family 1 protein [Candidatus Berkelbacteria bacterium]|nr:glycosyltransferase family 1 protein [Candidatus Berkelbacteria bacterium]